MNISKTIKEQRIKLSLSQEELADKVYVTRQTISSWENDKSYPDINSLILLSQVFSITIDNLLKGDLEVMEKMIEKNDIKTMNKYGTLMAITLRNNYNIISYISIFKFYSRNCDGYYYICYLSLLWI